MHLRLVRYVLNDGAAPNMIAPPMLDKGGQRKPAVCAETANDDDYDNDADFIQGSQITSLDYRTVEDVCSSPASTTQWRKVEAFKNSFASRCHLPLEK